MTAYLDGYSGVPEDTAAEIFKGADDTPADLLDRYHRSKAVRCLRRTGSDCKLRTGKGRPASALPGLRDPYTGGREGVPTGSTTFWWTAAMSATRWNVPHPQKAG